MPFILLAIYSDWTISVLRVAAASIMLVHGWPKMRDLKKTQENFGAMGFRPGVFWGTLVAVVEVIGGLMLLLGVWTQVIALLFMGEFATILIWRIRQKHPFVQGWEIDLLIFATMLLLLTIGGGVLSVDHWLSLLG